MKTTKTTSVRLTNTQLAKARDGLIALGIDQKHLSTRSSILRLCVYLAITKTSNPDDLPSTESAALLEMI